MAFEEEDRQLLKSIDASLKIIAASAKARLATAPKPLASDRDLDGSHGNPEIKFMPRDWSGENCKGRPMSECPAAFLDMLAETLDYFAQKAEESDEKYNGKPVAPYKRADAARARGWAKRIRDGKVTPAAATKPGATDNEWDSPSWP